MAQIHINQNTCIRCKKCVRICPSALFTLQEDKGIEVNADDCISCGHCVAVCPTDSIEHADFPSEKVHTIDRSQLPTRWNCSSVPAARTVRSPKKKFRKSCYSAS